MKTRASKRILTLSFMAMFLLVFTMSSALSILSMNNSYSSENQNETYPVITDKFSDQKKIEDKKLFIKETKANKVQLFLIDSNNKKHLITMMPGYSVEFRNDNLYWIEQDVIIGGKDSNVIHMCDGYFHDECELFIIRKGNSIESPYVATIKVVDESAPPRDDSQKDLDVSKEEHQEQYHQHLNQKATLPTSFNDIIQYVIPVPDQFDAGSCAFMSSTVIMEILANKSENIQNPTSNSKYDLSERFTMNYEYYYTTPSVKKFLRDLPLTFNDARGSVPIGIFPFKMSNGSTYINWDNAIKASILKQRMTLPKISKFSIFYDSRLDTQGYHVNGRMKQAHIDQMKAELVEHQSPIFYVYYPTGSSWWHAVAIIGYDDTKGNFIAIDSSFGNKTTDLYYYGRTTSTAKGYPRLKDTVKYLSYKSVLKYGIAATLYYLE
ncbi:MAG: hypothetical protein HQK49_12220 [Oligoflexia bacterium]|nr:hypothetical protein [Oligoflexia bacterium]